MATTTPNLGLIKPENSDVAQNWVTQNDTNANILDSALKTGEFINHIPAGLVGIDFGDAETSGGYVILPKGWITGWAIYELGSTFVADGDDWQLSLPFDLDTNLYFAAGSNFGLMIGEASLRDRSSSTDTQTGLLQTREGNRFYIVCEDNSGNEYVNDVSPFTWEETDILSISYFYKGIVT